MWGLEVQSHRGVSISEEDRELAAGVTFRRTCLPSDGNFWKNRELFRRADRFVFGGSKGTHLWSSHGLQPCLPLSILGLHFRLVLISLC